MIKNRAIKFDNFWIGGTFEQLDIDDPEEAQIWADYDLAILVENRCGIAEDPNGWSNQQRKYWRNRCLLPTESFLGPEAWGRYQHFWIKASDDRAGIIALGSLNRDNNRLFVGSLYLLPKFRGFGLGKKVLAFIEEAAFENSFQGIELETDWHWQNAVHFYLENNFWLDKWQRNLTFIKDRGLPNYRFAMKNNWASFELGSPFNAVVFQADRKKSYTDYAERPLPYRVDWNFLRQISLNTFGLFLAMSGWPLKDSFLSRLVPKISKKRLAPKDLMQYIEDSEKRQPYIY
jgi:GNAT superfamily N-acetyltransferase